MVVVAGSNDGSDAQVDDGSDSIVQGLIGAVGSQGHAGHRRQLVVLLQPVKPRTDSRRLCTAVTVDNPHCGQKEGCS